MEGGGKKLESLIMVGSSSFVRLHFQSISPGNLVILYSIFYILSSCLWRLNIATSDVRFQVSRHFHSIIITKIIIISSSFSYHHIQQISRSELDQSDTRHKFSGFNPAPVRTS